MLYLVKAVDKQGRDQEFMVEEVGARVAAASIRSRGFFPFEVTECPPQKDEPLSRFKPESIKPCVQPEPQSAVLTCHACTNIMAKSLKKCPHCGAPRESTNEEKLISQIVGFFALIVMMFFIFPFFGKSCSSSPSSTAYSPVSSHDDSTVTLFDTPLGNEMIRGMAEESGVNEREMRQAVEHELDRRGLMDWANGKE